MTTSAGLDAQRYREGAASDRDDSSPRRINLHSLCARFARVADEGVRPSTSYLFGVAAALVAGPCGGWSRPLPMASPDRTNSTRRFCARPSAVSFDAIGSFLPKPWASTLADAIPCWTK